jgi:hypothetical protein
MAIAQHTTAMPGAETYIATEVATLSAIEAAYLYETMANLYEAATAFQNAPRFSKEGIPGSFNAAGRVLDDFSETIGVRLEALVERMKKAPRPETKFEREYLARVLIRHASVYADSILEIVAIAASLAAPERH